MPDTIGSHTFPEEGVSTGLVGVILAGWVAETPKSALPEPVPAAAVPPAYRRLLDQPRGMTAVLTEHWGGNVRLRVRRQGLSADGAVLARDIVLLAGPGDLPVELAGIRIRLDAFDPGLRGRVRQGAEPFGRVLESGDIRFDVEVLGLLCLPALGAWAAEGRVPAGAPLFGRLGRLRRRDTGQVLAETVELLPRTRLSPVA